MSMLKSFLFGDGHKGSHHGHSSHHHHHSKHKSSYDRGFSDGLWMKSPSHHDRKNSSYMRGHFDGFDEGWEEDNDFL